LLFFIAASIYKENVFDYNLHANLEMFRIR